MKTRVMDETMNELANLAYYLGYAWCAGCMAQYVGEGFIRDGDSWKADTRGKCEGPKADQRLSMNYGDFSFSIKDIKYGKPIIQDLQPQRFDQGVLTNDGPSSDTLKIEHSAITSRTVTHSTTSMWRASHEGGIEINYTPSGATGGFGGNIHYTFKYAHGSKTTRSNKEENKHIFKISQTKELPGYTQVSWKIMVSKMRSTIPYTATIIPHFSVELEGHMRDNSNFHIK